MRFFLAVSALVELLFVAQAPAQHLIHNHEVSPIVGPVFRQQESAIIKLKRFHAGRAIIIGNFTSFAEANVFAEGIAALGGRVDQIHNHRVIVAYLPPSADVALLADKRVRLLSRTPVDLKAEPFSLDEVAYGVARYFNRTIDGSLIREVEAMAGEALPPPGIDVVLAPSRRSTAHSESLLEHGAVRTDTYANESMTGRIGIIFQFVESDGTIDTNEFTWTSTDRGTIITEAPRATAGGSRKHLTGRYQ